MKKAFTVMEVIFVIIVLGILSAIALPKFAATKTIADISKGHADVATIRSAIVSERQTQLVKGIPGFIPYLSANTEILFTGDGTRKLLMYGIKASSDAGWTTSDTTDNKYTFTVDTDEVTFTYYDANGTFTCNPDGTNGDICKKLIY